MTTTPRIPERRKARRFQVALRVVLREGTGITRDLSVSGVFFETNRAFAVGEVIQFALVLEHIDPSRPVRLQCRGPVVRVERRGEAMGVAVAITAYRLHAQAHGEMGALCRSAR